MKRKLKFTLLEILLAMAIFVMALMPLLGVLMTSSGVHGENLRKIQANMLANQILGQLQVYSLSTGLPSEGVLSNLQESGQTKGLHWVLVGRKEMKGLIKFKLGVTFRNPDSTEHDYALGPTSLTLNGSNKVKRGYYVGSRYVFLGTGVNGDILSYQKVTGSDFAPVLEGLARDPGVAPSGGKAYAMDYVFTLWMNHL